MRFSSDSLMLKVYLGTGGGAQPAPRIELMSTNTVFAPLFRPLLADAPRPDADPPPSRTLHDVEGELETVAHEAETRRQDAATKAA
jgi:hypothetical protein